jgi:D-alanyl-D-alanine carboxypeptidase/D-alanyl-D-alanine-endopeptidase (penicillin-binding protein 4)
MAALVILEADARAAARLSAALASEHKLASCASWERLHETLEHGTFDGCIVDADHPDRPRALRQIALLRERDPDLAVIACVDAGHDLGCYDLGGLGVAGILLRGPQAPVRILAEVDRALARARADRIARTLEGRFRSPAPDAIGWAVEHAGQHTSVEKLAAALGYTPRSLRHALEQAGFPAPTRVLLWGRLLLAGARLTRDGRTVEEVAFSLGYATATSLARAMKRQTGLTPGEVSGGGGMDCVLRALFPDTAAHPAGCAARRLGKIAAVALTLGLGGCATLGLAADTVDRRAIDDVLRAPPLERAHVGVLAVEAGSGRTLYARNADRWFVPASNQKVLVAAAAWSLLGPDYRWRTELHAAGTVHEGRLEGDLVLVASGDPSLSRRYWGSGTAALDALANRVRASGVHEVSGRLVVDVSRWDSTTVAPTREVDDLVFAYGATGGAFAIDEGELQVVVRGAARAGEPADVEWSPRGEDGRVYARVETVPPEGATRVAARYFPESRRLVLEGTVGAGRIDTLAFAQRDPVRWASAELAAALARAGVRVRGGWTVRWTQDDKQGAGVGNGGECAALAALESPPLARIVADMLGPSQNWIAEQLVRTLGAEAGRAGSLADGLATLAAFLRLEVGVDSLDVRPRDGSGLSAYNLVTPRALVRVLAYMDARPDRETFRGALAEPGEKGSTLEDRLAGLEGRVFAKTGSISNVHSLSGFIAGRPGGDVVFSILMNAAGAPPGEVRGAIDRVVRLLAR